MLKKIEFITWLSLSILFFVFAFVVLFKGFGLTKAGGGGASIVVFLVSLVYEVLPEKFGRFVVSTIFVILAAFFLLRLRNIKWN